MAGAGVAFGAGAGDEALAAPVAVGSALGWVPAVVAPVPVAVPPGWAVVVCPVVGDAVASPSPLQAVSASARTATADAPAVAVRRAAVGL